jgi:hypothetical protein
MIYVNNDKLKRANEILGLINGTLVPQSDIEIERKSRFAAHLAAAKIKADSEGAVEFIYAKLGGLIRSEAEQATFVEKVKAAAKRKK